MTKTKKLREKLAKVYCLPKHSHKVLDPELLEDFITAIKKWALEMVGKDVDYNESDYVGGGYNKGGAGYNKAKQEIRDRINE